VNGLDKIIIEKANDYGIPPALIKSIIYKETKFKPNTYRYEAHIDYDWYSGPNSGDRILTHPNHHFTIQGKDTRGRTISKGNQLPSNYLAIARDYSFLSLNTTDTNGDGNLTAAELVANNPKQGWEQRPDWNFTAQLALASSYGLTQLLYETARWNGLDNTSEGQSAENIYNLFKPEVSIEIGAHYLKYLYGANGSNWLEALRGWNAGEGYAEKVYNLYLSEKFDLQ